MTIAERRAAGIETRASPVKTAEYTAPVYRPAPPHTGTNGFAITALILGLVGGSILAVIFGHIAKAQIRRTGEQGNGLATAGLILGYAGTALLAIVLISMIVAAVSYRGY
ncbi:DUF4190 domain-containing protein [Arthrobacter globiformis]|uniref:DUF4190 domain-containing protein n=1 Tax=Arthrobacter globiformis TaxID=1665 RepID=UPI00278678CE|nr:DUF4190 domain-containing protein [Arthrobacter globiformis]MDQ0864861.1 hypothetical protein [Arthrobacter globiformis]